MAKNDFIHNSIDVFREKLDNARQGDNAAAEILRAVHELLAEIHTQYPQIAYQPDSIADQSLQAAKSFGKNNKMASMQNKKPDGVQYMLSNLAAHKQQQD